MTPSLIELVDIRRSFRMGDETITALDGVSLSITAGEMVAIVGASGSGKSTLMNVIGCLDRPTSGSFRVDGVEVGNLSRNELARLRLRRFGFIFQRYHLMSSLSAVGNVEVPAVYDGALPLERRQRAQGLLTRLGLAERLNYQPGKLSGGQQQRVSIARALMNGGEIILADEPTGALDPRSGEAVMEILKSLNQEGHTIIIVTHDMALAEQAGRVIEISRGRVAADRRTAAWTEPKPRAAVKVKQSSALGAWMQAVGNAMNMAIRSMVAQPMRTLLTMLGIVIGIASVAAVTALGAGSQQKMMAQLADLGASTMEIYPGADWGDERAGQIRTLVAEDALALEKQPYIAAASPMIFSGGRVRYDKLTLNASVLGVSGDYAKIMGRRLVAGQMFDTKGSDKMSTSAVIAQNMADRLFGNESALGRILMVGRVPVTVVGVIAAAPNAGKNLELYLPYSSVSARMTGSTRLDSVILQLADKVDPATAEGAATEMLTQRHGRKDFYIFNSDLTRKAVEKSQRTMSQLITAVAIIALTVGGIGVMNIMLVSVSERTKEIGLRMAVGARPADIMLQFLVEAVVICSVGAVLGVVLALAAGFFVGSVEGQFPMIFSASSISLACCAATAVGLGFGLFPARNAAQLDPVDALSRD